MTANSSNMALKEVDIAEKQDRVVPYFCQWESSALAHDIVTGNATPADDSAWVSSGASNQEEYIKWANHICGIACLKMILASRTGQIFPTLELLKNSLPYGTYTFEGENIRGLIYAPFVNFVREAFKMDSRIQTEISALDIPEIMADSDFFIASVHPWVRWPEKTPPFKGGHLVLVTDATENEITFHNPSGDTQESQIDAKVSLEQFDKFFSGRGIVISREYS